MTAAASGNPVRSLPCVSSVLLWRDDGALLLQHRDDIPGLPYAGVWTTPGGHCEPDESAEACARREFEEETAYTLTALRFVTRIFEDQVPESPPHWVTFFSARYDGAQRLECREGQALCFVARHDAPGLRMPRYLLELWDLTLDLR